VRRGALFYLSAKHILKILAVRALEHYLAVFAKKYLLLLHNIRLS
jgi:hypothetical protein